MVTITGMIVAVGEMTDVIIETVTTVEVDMKTDEKAVVATVVAGDTTEMKE